MVENKNKKIIKTINKFCGIPWIAELWVLTEQIAIIYHGELLSMTGDYDGLRILIFQESLKTILKDQNSYLNHTFYSKKEQRKRKGIRSLMRVKETHLNIEKTSKIIEKTIHSLTYPVLKRKLSEIELKYEMEYAKKEFLRKSYNGEVSTLTRNEIEKLNNNEKAIKATFELQQIIEQIKNGATTVTEVADNLDVSRMTIYRRFKKHNTTFKQLYSSVTSVT